VGASDLLNLVGNPVNFFNQMGSGVKAFFHEPYKSLQEGGNADDFMDGNILTLPPFD
jgi:hypothetical protein